MGPSSVSIISALHTPGELLDPFLRRLDETADDSTEIILVDDCSGDGTVAALERWRDGRTHITIIANETNKGVATSRNIAVAAATSEFIWFVDHDDVWDPEITRVLRFAASASPHIDVVACRAEYRYDPAVPGPIVDGLNDTRTMPGYEALRLMAGNVVHGFLWSKLIRREVIWENPFPPLSSQSDVAGLAQIMANANQVAFIPNILYSYINTPGSITRIRKPNFSNLAAARQAVIDAVRLTAPEKHDDTLLDFFTCWFYVKALVVTPLRQMSGPDVVLPALKQARQAVTGMSLRPVLDRSKGLWLLMWGVRLAPRATSFVVKMLYAALDASRSASAALKK